MDDPHSCESTVDSATASPDWHGDVLIEQDRLISSGGEQFIDWEVAKQQLRREIQSSKSILEK